MHALLALKEEGLAAHLGVAGGDIELMRRFVGTGAFEVVLTHNRYTLVDQSATPLLEDAEAAGVGVLNAAPFGGGILAKGPEALRKYAYTEAKPEVLDRVRAMSRLCAEAGVPLGAAALQYSIRDPRITSTVVGMSSPERVAHTVAWATWPIPDDLWDALAPLSSSG